MLQELLRTLCVSSLKEKQQAEDYILVDSMDNVVYPHKATTCSNERMQLIS